MDETAGGLLEVSHLHQRSGEVKVTNVGGLPLWRLSRETIVDHQLRPAVLGENRSVETKSGADDYPVVAKDALRFVGSRKANGDVVRTVAPLDAFYGAIQQRVLRLELISIQQVVVHCSQMAHVMGPPREMHPPWTRDVNHCRGFE